MKRGLMTKKELAELDKMLVRLQSHLDMKYVAAFERYEAIVRARAVVEGEIGEQWKSSPNNGRTVRTTKEDRESFAGEQK